MYGLYEKDFKVIDRGSFLSITKYDHKLLGNKIVYLTRDRKSLYVSHTHLSGGVIITYTVLYQFFYQI